MKRKDGRESNELRKIFIDPLFTDTPYASVLIKCGKTTVWCAASVEEEQPKWMKHESSMENKGWVTAEYSMLPGATSPRSRREGRDAKLSGRTQEIQRLIGRSLRSVVKLEELGPRTITIDCDVLQADGGTRTTAITGAFVALKITLHRLIAQKRLKRMPLKDSVAAISCGLLRTEALLDLPYCEDVAADVDMNIVMTGSGRFVEIQGTGEESTFIQDDLLKLIQLARTGIDQLTQLQESAVKEALRRLNIAEEP